MSERSWFPHGVSDPEPESDANRSAIYVGVPLPSSSSSRGDQAGNAMVVQICDSTPTANAAVAAPACGYGGIVYVLGNRMLRGVGRFAAGAMLSLEPTVPSRWQYGSSDSRYECQDDWLRSLLSSMFVGESEVPYLPLKTCERQRVFPPPWNTEKYEPDQLAFLLANER